MQMPVLFTSIMGALKKRTDLPLIR